VRSIFSDLMRGGGPTQGGSMEIRLLDDETMAGLDQLFGSDRLTMGCWCMWFIVPVKGFHASGGAGNRESFLRLAAESEHPLGLVAYRDEEPVGWCAVGPRSRYARGIRTPTYAGRDASEDDAVWLVPCLYLRADARHSGLAKRMVDCAVNVARERSASAIEAFPLSGKKRHNRDTQVGFESVFAACGFAVIGRPTPSRTLMRLDLDRAIGG
jgi:GNAT superfamily N-acetyltransferase